MRRRRGAIALWVLTGLLSLAFLGGPDLAAAGDEPSAGAKALELSDLVVPLISTEPGEVRRPSDLMALSSWLPDARVIALGESPHGVHEYHRLAHRIFAHLVREEGFSVFALEISQAHADRLNEYTLGKRDDLESLLAQHWWPAEVFYDAALGDLLKWMRQHNRTADRIVRIAGFDFKQPSFAMAGVVERLRLLDSGAATQVEALYAEIPERGLGVFPNVSGFNATFSKPVSSDLSGEELRVRVQVRGQGVSHGSVGLAVRLDDDWRSQSGQLEAERVSTHWTPITVSTRVPERARELHLEVFHRGNGTVWFSGLSAEANGSVLEIAEVSESPKTRPLMIPGLQSMDYEHRSDTDVTFEGAVSLRVECDGVVDEILAGVRRAQQLVGHQISGHEDRLSREDAAWLAQLARLIEQSAEWRTLAQTNRDVFMAENVEWLLREAFPGARILLLAHRSHTERIPHKMGSFLANSLGPSYAPVTLLARSGRYAYFGDVGSHQPGDSLTIYDVAVADRGLAQRLHQRGMSDVLVNLAGVSRSAPEWGWLTAAEPPGPDAADAAIVINRASPIRPLSHLETSEAVN